MRFSVLSPVSRILAALLLLSGPALAQTTGEQLFVPPPSGWTIVHSANEDGIETTGLSPQGQTAENWSDMLAVAVTQGAPKKAPQDVLKDKLTEIEAACDSVGAGPVGIAQENGYDTAMRAIACPRTKTLGKGEISLIKAMNGKERSYLIIRAWRGPAFEKDQMPLPAETTKQWLAFMNRVVLCDSRNPARHPCPKTR